jgi:hypothetical protein
MAGDRQEKKRYITRHINMIDMNKKAHVCSILLIHGIDVKQNNNGAYCFFDELDDALLDVVYQYLKSALEPTGR